MNKYLVKLNREIEIEAESDEDAEVKFWEFFSHFPTEDLDITEL